MPRKIPLRPLLISSSEDRCPRFLTLLLCDVMLGRGVDQVRPHPGDLRLRQSLCEMPGIMWSWPRRRTADPAVGRLRSLTRRECRWMARPN